MSQFPSFFGDILPEECGGIVGSYECIPPSHPCHPDQGGCENPVCAQRCEDPNCWDRSDYYACCHCGDEIGGSFPPACCNNGGYPGCPCDECTACGGFPPGAGCDPFFDPVEIPSASFTVDGNPGVVDSDRSLDEGSNCPVVDSTVVVTPFVVGGQNPTVNFKFFINGGEILQNGISDTLVIPRDLAIFDDVLVCEMVANDTSGTSSNTFALNMGWVHGKPPVVSNTLQNFVSTDSGEVVVPGQTIEVTYTENSSFDIGYPPASTISSTVNVDTILEGNPYTYTVASDGDERECKVKINFLTVDNSAGGVPRTSSQSKFFIGNDGVIASVSNPEDGAPCGEPTGACCKGGVFDDETGITTGSCTIETEDVCDNTIGGEYKGNGTICGDFPGAPCFEEIGVGRCCCVTNNDIGECEEDVTFDYCMNGEFSANNNCDLSHPSTSPTGVTWSHNQSCPSTPCDVPCCSPPLGKCCEVVGEDIEEGGEVVVFAGATCSEGVEQIDCPRYDGGIEGASYEWQGSGASNCGDCKDISYNFSYTGQNEYCCEPLGRCCRGGAPLEGDSSLYYYESECIGNLGTWIEGEEYPDCSTNPGLPCCPQLGKCCWKPDGLDGNCQALVPESFCDSQPGTYGSTKQWTSGTDVCPDCVLDEAGAQNSESNLCCDTVLGRCCTKLGPVAFCQPDQLYSNCDQEGSQEWDFINSPCPDCGSLNLIERDNEQCCSSPIGRCCWKTGDDGNCRENQTLGECSLLAGKSIQAIIGDGNFVEGGVCPANQDGTGCSSEASENDLCCDTVVLACCDQGTCFGPKSFSECEELGGKQIIGLDECPACETDCPGLGCDECCGDASLSITGFLVDGQPYDTDLNPIRRGKTVSVQISQSLVYDITYQFEVNDAGNQTIIASDIVSGSDLELPPDIPLSVAAEGGGFISLPGLTITSRVSATSLIDDTTLEAVQDLQVVHGDPPSLPGDPNSVNEVYYGAGIGLVSPAVPPDGMNENTVLSPGNFVSIFGSGFTSAGADPFGNAISPSFVDENGTVLSTNAFYQIVGNEPGCGVNLKVIIDNTVVGGRPIPGGGVSEEIYNLGQVVTPEGEGVCAVDGDEGRCCCGGSIDPITGITAGSCDEMVTEFDCNQRVVNGECVEVSWNNEFYQNGTETFCPTCDERNSVSYPCCPVYPTGRCCITGSSCQDNVFQTDCPSNGVWDKDKVCPATPCQSSDIEEQRCGCDPSVTGACCCPFEGCIENVSESDCNGQYCTDNLKPSLYYAPGNPAFPNSDLKSPVWLGPDTTCPEADELDCNFMCCELGDKDLDINGNLANDGSDVLSYSCTGRTSATPQKTTCLNRISNNPCGQLLSNSFRKRCYSPVLPDGSNLELTQPCDYRYRKDLDYLSNDYEYCALNGLCSCYRVTDPFETGSGDLLNRTGCVPLDRKPMIRYDSTSDLVTNPVYMCERVVNKFDVFCAGDPGEDFGDVGWDEYCVEQAKVDCTFKKASNGSLDSNNLLVQYCKTTKDSFVNSAEGIWYNTHCDTVEEDHVSHQPLIDLNDEYVNVYRQEYYGCGNDTGSPTEDNSQVGADRDTVYADGIGLPCIDTNGIMPGISWQECRLLVNGCNVPGSGCSNIQECIEQCTITVGDDQPIKGG